jgi:hypothetical protein
MKHILNLLFVATVLFFGFHGKVNAQISFPEFPLTNTNDTLLNNALTPREIENSINNFKNPLLRDIIILQNQIIILEGLIERQGEIRNIANNYRKVGVPFKQSPPRESTCDQLPINALCMASYPEKGDNKFHIQEAYERYQELQKQEIINFYEDLMIQQANDMASANNGGNTSSTASPMRPQAQFQWSDIRCLSGQCSALVESSRDSFRKRVSIGENLANTNIKISDIGVTGVMILRNGQKVKMSAKDATNDPNITETVVINENRNQDEISEIESILANSFGGLNNVPANAPAAPDSGELLGPTGLF